MHSILRQIFMLYYNIAYSYMFQSTRDLHQGRNIKKFSRFPDDDLLWIETSRNIQYDNII